MKKNVVVSLLSFGALFVVLVFTAPNETARKRYIEDAEAIVAASIEPEIQDTSEIEVQSTSESENIDEGHTSEYIFYDVVRVVDGDTVKIMRGGKEETLRLIGMNTPETVDPRTTVECFGKEASNKAKEFLSGKRVRLEFDAGEGELDKYRRTLAYIYTEDGVMFNEWMIRNGYAYEYTYDDAYKYQKEFKAAETYARDNGLGLWSADTCSGLL